MKNLVHTHRFWGSPGGSAVKGWLEGWGAVHRERLLTGDPSALPQFKGGSAGRSARTVGNVSDVLLRFADIEDWLKGGGTERHLALLTEIYVNGLDWVERIQYVFEDDSRSDWLMAGQHELPKVKVKATNVEYKPFYAVDLSRLDMPELRDTAERWGYDLEDLIDREHVRLGRLIAYNLNLAPGLSGGTLSIEGVQPSEREETGEVAALKEQVRRATELIQDQAQRWAEADAIGLVRMEEAVAEALGVTPKELPALGFVKTRDFQGRAFLSRQVRVEKS